MGIHLSSFLEAQEADYAVALSEIRSGRKRGHWMWYIFPQVAGLGLSEVSAYYAIKDLDEAREYLSDTVLGRRLREISKALLLLREDDALKIFGSPDNLKLRSSMTLFAQAEKTNDNVFRDVLDRFFDGKADSRTLEILGIAD